MLQEVLTAALKQEHREAGLYLEEDEDFLYLKHGKVSMGIWHGRTAAIVDIWALADLYVLLMANADKYLCPCSGCDLGMYVDQLHDSHKHYNGDGQLIFSYPRGK